MEKKFPGIRSDVQEWFIRMNLHADPRVSSDKSDKSSKGSSDKSDKSSKR